MSRMKHYLHWYSLGILQVYCAGLVESRGLCEHPQYYNQYFNVAIYVKSTGFYLETLEENIKCGPTCVTTGVAVFDKSETIDTAHGIEEPCVLLRATWNVQIQLQQR